MILLPHETFTPPALRRHLPHHHQWRDVLFVDAEDSITLGCCWNGACGVAAEHAVAQAGDEAVAGLAEEARNKRERPAEEAPGIVEELQDLGYAVGAMVDALFGGKGVGDEDDPVGGHVEVEMGEDLLGQWAFEGDEADFGAFVALEQEADEVIAESANAIEEENGVGFDLGALDGSHLIADESGHLKFLLQGLLYWMDATEPCQIPPVATSC